MGMDKQMAALKQEWHEELVQLKKRCKIIENRLQSLDDNGLPTAGKLNHGTSSGRGGLNNIKADIHPGSTALERAKHTLSEIAEPFTLVQLRTAIRENGLGEIHRGNWGTIVQMLKKTKMIACCEGEPGKPGALYKRVPAVESAGTAPASWGTGKKRGKY
jgi:hypothetical protein